MSHHKYCYRLGVVSDISGVSEAILRQYDRVAGNATPQRSSTMAKSSVLTTASDATEIDTILVVGVATPHQLFKIIVTGTVFVDNPLGQKSVTSYLESKSLLPFSFGRQYIKRCETSVRELDHVLLIITMRNDVLDLQLTNWTFTTICRRMPLMGRPIGVDRL